MTAAPIKQPPGLAVQAFWLTASKFIAVLLNVGLPILLVRLMAQAEYGVYKEAFLFVGTATNVATFGVGMSAFYFMPRYPERGGQIALNILVYNFLAGWIPLIILAFYPQVLKSLFRTSALGPLAILLGVLVLFTLTSSLVQQIPTALQDVRYSTIFIVGTQLVRAITLAAAVLLFRSVKSLIVAAILNQLFSIAVLFWYLHGRFPRFWAHFDWPFFKEQLAYALPYGAFGFLWVIQKDLDNYFVSASLGPRDYAIYAIGWLDVPLITLILESVASVMIVRISSLQQEDRKADIRYVTAAATNRLAAIYFPLFMLLLVAGHDLIVLLYTRTYEKSASIFQISILLLPMGVFLLDPIVRAYKELRNFVLGTRIVFFAVLFCVLFPVVRHFGMMGAAIAAVAAQVIERILIGWKAARVVDARLADLALYIDLFKVTGVTIAAGLVAYTVRNLISPALLIPRIAAVSICIGAIYLTAMFVFRLPGREALSKERIFSFARSTWARMSNA
ncbi:MAG TPA: oligosaccharide flippase family protein [Terriglobales bacterium]|jgi:O-antigen/teichoic acid export membrane protein